MRLLLWFAIVAIESSTLAFTVLRMHNTCTHSQRTKSLFGPNHSILDSDIGILERQRPIRCPNNNERKSLALALSSTTASDSGSTATTLDGRKILGDIVPLNNFILVRTAEAVAETTGGILLTGKAKQKKTQGTVVAVGPGRTHPDSGLVFAMPVSVGDTVVYGQYDGTEIDINGVPHTLIRDDDVLVKYPAANTNTELTLDSVQVVRDTVLVSIEQRKEMETEGGILIAKSSKTAHKPSTGTVVQVGPGKMAANGALMAMEVAVGDGVKFRDFAGNEVEIAGQEYSVVKMTDILAKF
jgi:chaperonin GroES